MLLALTDEAEECLNDLDDAALDDAQGSHVDHLLVILEERCQFDQLDEAAHDAFTLLRERNEAIDRLPVPLRQARSKMARLDGDFPMSDNFCSW